jgi:hypothetical protein
VPPTTGCRSGENQNFACCSGDIELSTDPTYTTVPADAFRNCAITSVKVGANIKIIGDYAFSYTGLVSVDLSETQVATIGGYAYRDCTALTSITFPSTVTSIGYIAFFDTRLVSVDLSETQVETIGRYAFNYCRALTSIKLPSTVKIIGDGVFANGPCSSSANTLYVPADMAESVYSAVQLSCTVVKYP